LGLLSPDGRDAMLQHAEQFHAAGIPFVFDPGQGLPMFNGEELLRFIELAEYVTVNDYESQLLQERTGLSESEIMQQVSALIVTRGAEGSVVYTAAETFEIPAVAVADIKDPTGCGDAYRAGLIFGLMNAMDWQTTCRIASLMGAIKIAHHGTQNHHFTMTEFSDKFEEAFSYRF
jgi:adenosine kinase